MPQAIITKVLSPTSTIPQRIKATCSRGSIIVSEDSPTEEAHIKVRNLLVAKFVREDEKRHPGSAATNRWARPWSTGQLANMDYVHVETQHKPSPHAVLAVCLVLESPNGKYYGFRYCSAEDRRLTVEARVDGGQSNVLAALRVLGYEGGSCYWIAHIISERDLFRMPMAGCTADEIAQFIRSRVSELRIKLYEEGAQ